MVDGFGHKGLTRLEIRGSEEGDCAVHELHGINRANNDCFSQLSELWKLRIRSHYTLGTEGVLFSPYLYT